MGAGTRILAILAIALDSSRSMVLPSMHSPAPPLARGGMHSLARGPISLLSPMRERAEIAPAAIAPLRRPEAHRLVTTMLKFGLRHCANTDDMLLAMVSPSAHRLLSEWRRTLIGDVSTCKRALEDARIKLLSVMPGAAVSVRTKGLWSTLHKVALRGKVPTDVLAVRIVVKDDHACFDALDLVHQLWPAAAGRLKDYITRPKANGYQALHETVLLPDGTPMEIQIRSERAHAHAEYGVASHRRYKGPVAEMPQLVLAGLAQ